MGKPFAPKDVIIRIEKKKSLIIFLEIVRKRRTINLVPFAVKNFGEFKHSKLHG